MMCELTAEGTMKACISLGYIADRRDETDLKDVSEGRGTGLGNLRREGGPWFLILPGVDGGV